MTDCRECRGLIFWGYSANVLSHDLNGFPQIFNLWIFVKLKIGVLFHLYVILQSKEVVKILAEECIYYYMTCFSIIIIFITKSCFYFWGQLSHYLGCSAFSISGHYSDQIIDEDVSAYWFWYWKKKKLKSKGCRPRSLSELRK